MDFASGESETWRVEGPMLPVEPGGYVQVQVTLFPVVVALAGLSLLVP